jgi:heme A synthase
MGLWDVEDPTLSRQSAHRWRLGFQSYTPAALNPQKSSVAHFCYRLSKPRSHGAAGKSNEVWDNKGKRISFVKLIHRSFLFARPVLYNSFIIYVHRLLLITGNDLTVIILCEQREDVPRHKRYLAYVLLCVIYVPVSYFLIWFQFGAHVT